MAYSPSLSLLSSLLALLLLVGPALAYLDFPRGGVPYKQDSRELIRNICRNARDPAFCIYTLDSRAGQYPRTLDVQELARLAINLAIYDARETLGVVSSFATGTRDSKLKTRYSLCAENYRDAIQALKEAGTYLKHKDNERVRIQVLGAAEEAGNCEKHLGKFAADPSGVRQRTVKFNNIVNIISAITVYRPQ